VVEEAVVAAGAADATAVKPARVSARDRREQYLAAAARIAAEQGVAMVTMEAIAAEVGVNKALLYRQFDNRGELLLALFDRETEELDRRVAEAIAGVHGFEPKVRAWAKAWFDHLAERAALFGRLMEARTIAPEVAVRHRERLRRLERSYGEWYARELDIPLEEARDAARVLLAGLGGAIDRWNTAPSRATRRRLEQTYVDLMLGGLARVASVSAPARAGRARARRP
jgi:AcrR family transcriptional regulator